MKKPRTKESFKYIPIYEPDEKRMLDALRILLNSKPMELSDVNIPQSKGVKHAN